MWVQSATPKTKVLPRVTVEAQRLLNYRLAYQAAQRREPDLSFAEWIRRGLDAHCQSVK